MSPVEEQKPSAGEASSDPDQAQAIDSPAVTPEEIQADLDSILARIAMSEEAEDIDEDNIDPTDYQQLLSEMDQIEKAMNDLEKKNGDIQEQLKTVLQQMRENRADFKKLSADPDSAETDPQAS